VVKPVAASWGYESPVGGEPVPDGFNYRSDNNDLWLTVDDMRELLAEK
jgi:UDP-N-acetylglucosamine 4,6-dehydratase